MLVLHKINDRRSERVMAIKFFMCADKLALSIGEIPKRELLPRRRCLMQGITVACVLEAKENFLT